jgi:hypothetical protein
LTCSEADCNEDNEDGDQRLEDDLGQHLEHLFNKKRKNIGYNCANVSQMLDHREKGE